MNMKKALRLVFLTPILTLIAWLPAGVALGHTGGYDRWFMGPGMMGNWGFGWFGGVYMILFWILVIMALFFFVRWMTQSGTRYNAAGSGTNHALDILRERYAKGEIEKEEFEHKKKDLTR